MMDIDFSLALNPNARPPPDCPKYANSEASFWNLGLVFPDIFAVFLVPLDSRHKQVVSKI
jgi:hypothetical protein